MARQKSNRTFETAGETYISEGVEGEGLTSFVYRVVDSENRRWALKCLKPQQATHGRVKRFLNELHFCENVRHRNIVRVVDKGFATQDDTKCPFYVMPLYSSTLRKLMNARMSPEKVLPCFAELLSGVEAAHLRDAVHRDLKPENILHDPMSGEFVVSDFGIAHFNSELMLVMVETNAHERLANARYAAPEQLSRNGTVDHRADVYALGLILNEMFTGHVPYGAGFAQIGNGAPQFAYLDELVESMVQQDPAKRPSSIDEVKQALIARRNDFIERQKLDGLKKTVVTASTVSHPFCDNPPRVVDYDIDPVTRRLTMVLDKSVPEEWMAVFRTPRNAAFIRGTAPYDWRFHYSTETDRIVASVTLHPHDVLARESMQMIIDNFKNYVDFANRTFLRGLERTAKADEDRKKKELQEKIAYEEQRRRLREGLKV